jgi:hypothetical protein
MTGYTNPVPDADAPRGVPERVILIVFMVVTLLASWLVLHSAAEKQKNDPALKAARGEITAFGPLSFFQPQNLRKAVGKVQTGRWPLIISLRVEPTRVDITARDRDGFRKDLSINVAYKVTTFDDNVGTDQVFKPNGIDYGAPARMVRAVGERTHLGPDAVNYLVTNAGGPADSAWYMALDKGPATVRQWVATSSGADLRHPGVLSQSQQAANAKLKRSILARVHQAELNAKCLGHAFTAAAVNRCNRKFPVR